METFPGYLDQYEIAFAPEARERLRRLPASVARALVEHLRRVGEVAALLPYAISSGWTSGLEPPLVVTVCGVSARYLLLPERRAVKVLEVVPGA